MKIEDIAELTTPKLPLWMSPAEEVTFLRVQGGDRSKFLQGFTTNDVKNLAEYSGCETFLLNIKGKILGHVFVLNACSELILVGVAGQQEKLMTHLDKYVITEDVQLTGEKYTSVILGGTDLQIFEQQFQVNLNNHLQHAKIQYDGLDLCVIKRDDMLIPVYQILIREQDVEAFNKLVSFSRLTEDETRLFRMGSGFPVYGLDLSEDNLAQECCRTAIAISFHKGCYLGQEPVARIDALGHVNQKLRIVSFKIDEVSKELSNGESLLLTDPDTKKELGRITSLNKMGDRYVGLGIIKKHVAEPETRFTAKINDLGIVNLDVSWINRE